jgi:multicomponent K+:H+ antiporter subunit D
MFDVMSRGVGGPVTGQLVDLTPHLPVLPIVLPLVVAAFMLLLEERRRIFKAGLGAGTMAALVLVAFVLLNAVAGEADGIIVYRLADWAAPFGIVLVVDRLAALMVMVTSILGLAAFVFAVSGWAIVSPRFHSLFLLLVMGVNGAFLTGDLFNLYVFFEVLLAASYGLLLHGSGRARIKAGLQYIAVNLGSSILFLIGAGLIYAVTGTLNLVDIMRVAATLAEQDATLFRAGLAVLSVAFLTKAGVWPLSFWLPVSYPVATPPVSAMFVIMTKVGAYVLLRVVALAAGVPETGLVEFLSPWLLYGGIATILFGSMGLLSSTQLPRIASYATLVTAGTLVAAVGTADERVISGALYYLIGSTLATGAAFLLAELIARLRPVEQADAGVEPVFGDDYETSLQTDFEGYEVGVAIPAGTAMLGGAFVVAALVLAGLPPLSGFLAKFAIVSGVMNGGTGLPREAWVLAGVVVFSGLATLISLMRKGIDAFWKPGEENVAEVRSLEALPIGILLSLCVALTLFAAPVVKYLDATSAYLADPVEYARDVLEVGE